MLNQDTLREATRLTHAGQLAEATALLQGMFRGDRAPDAASRIPGPVSLPGREPPTIDAKANDIKQTDSVHPARAPVHPRDPAVIRSSKGWFLARNARCEARPAGGIGYRAGEGAVHRSRLQQRSRKPGLQALHP